MTPRSHTMPLTRSGRPRPAASTLPFDAPDAAQRLDNMTEAELQQLPYLVELFDPQGRTLKHNRAGDRLVNRHRPVDPLDDPLLHRRLREQIGLAAPDLEAGQLGKINGRLCHRRVRLILTRSNTLWRLEEQMTIETK